MVVRPFFDVWVVHRYRLGIERTLTKTDEFGHVSFVSFDRSMRN